MGFPENVGPGHTQGRGGGGAILPFWTKERAAGAGTSKGKWADEREPTCGTHELAGPPSNKAPQRKTHRAPRVLPSATLSSHYSVKVTGPFLSLNRFFSLNSFR